MGLPDVPRDARHPQVAVRPEDRRRRPRLGDHFGGRTFEPPLGEPGYPRLLAKFRAPYQTQDGYICALVYNDKQWKSFFERIGKPELFMTDPRFSTHVERAKHIDAVYALVKLLARTMDEAKAHLRMQS